MKFLIFSRKDGSSGCGDATAIRMILKADEAVTTFGEWLQTATVGDYMLVSDYGIVRVKDW